MARGITQDQVNKVTADFTDAREQLEQARRANGRAVEDAQTRERSAVNRAQGAEKQRDAALVRMADLDRLMEAQVAQLDEISGQRRDALARGDDLQSSVNRMTLELRQLAEGAAEERERRDA